MNLAREKTNNRKIQWGTGLTGLSRKSSYGYLFEPTDLTSLRDRSDWSALTSLMKTLARVASSLAISELLEAIS